MNRLNSLRHLVASERCLLHGSPKKVDELHPHFTDGELALCATQYPEIAIFMALTRGCKDGKSAYTISTSGSRWAVTFTICENILKQLLDENFRGYVYALDAEGFTKSNHVEYRLFESRYSLRSMTVTRADLPFFLIEGEMLYTVPLNPLFAHLAAA